MRAGGNMRKSLIIGLVFLASTSYAAAQTETPPTAQAAPEAPSAHPWAKARTLLQSVEADVQAGGIRAVGAHIPDLEQALLDGAHAFEMSAGPDGTTIVLTDGMAETLVALAAVSKSAGTRKVESVANPYPLIALYLASYYDEIGKFEDALRVLDAGLKLDAVPDLKLGETLPLLISERGAALNGLHRWDDSLANFDDGLRIASMSDADRARLFRGRGFALTELRRLDDAEVAYRNSLKLAPNNPGALNELAYIAQLRAGGQAEPGKIAIPAKPQ